MEKNKEKKLQLKLLFSPFLGSLIIFLTIKLIWTEVHSSLLLILLSIGFVISLVVSIYIQKTKDKENGY